MRPTFLQGRKCIFCGSFKVNQTARGYVKCSKCHQQKRLTRLRCEVVILTGFYQQQAADRLAADLHVDVKVVTRVHQRLCMVLHHVTELKEVRLWGEIKLDESYFVSWTVACAGV